MMERKPELQPFQFDWKELSGALGDLGVLLPLLAALITLNGLPTTGVFVSVGLAYILAGAYYHLPVPVQPLKAMSAVAITQGLSGDVIAAGGWWMAAILLLLATTGAIRWVGRLFTRPVVRGIQLGLGLLLIRSGVMLAGRSQGVPGGDEAVIHLAAYPIPLNWLLAGLAVLLLGGALRGRRRPAALIVLSFGATMALTMGTVSPGLGQVKLGLNLPRLTLPSASDFLPALLLLVIPQLPLTLGNAVFATVDTARLYFGDHAQRVTPRALLTTMGLSQAVAAMIGGVPICHGSSGLTAHYKLGARTGAAPLIMGIVCLALGLFVDGGALPILTLIPYPVLGVLLAFVGLQHSLLVCHLTRWDEIVIALSIAAVSLVTHNLAIGLGVGIMLHQGWHLGQGFLIWRATVRSDRNPL